MYSIIVYLRFVCVCVCKKEGTNACLDEQGNDPFQGCSSHVCVFKHVVTHQVSHSPVPSGLQSPTTGVATPQAMLAHGIPAPAPAYHVCGCIRPLSIAQNVRHFPEPFGSWSFSNCIPACDMNLWIVSSCTACTKSIAIHTFIQRNQNQHNSSVNV